MHQISLSKKIIGYIILGGLLMLLFLNYGEQALNTPTPFALFIIAAACAIVAVTVSIFFLWQEHVVEKVENLLGPIGHVFHCGYCFSLWLAAITVSILHIDLVGILSPHKGLTFLVSWWGLGFLNVLFFEIITLLWFQKVLSEFRLRELYKGRNH